MDQPSEDSLLGKTGRPLRIFSRTYRGTVCSRHARKARFSQWTLRGKSGTPLCGPGRSTVEATQSDPSFLSFFGTKFRDIFQSSFIQFWVTVRLELVRVGWLKKSNVSKLAHQTLSPTCPIYWGILMGRWTAGKCSQLGRFRLPLHVLPCPQSESGTHVFRN